MYLGKLTVAANKFIHPDGTKVRNSGATKKRQPKKHKRIVKRTSSGIEQVNQNKSENLHSGTVSDFSPDDWICSWRQSCVRCPAVVTPVTKQTMTKHIRASVSARQEAAFQVWWRESRSQTMQPRPATAPTAPDRLKALKGRLAARFCLAP